MEPPGTAAGWVGSSAVGSLGRARPDRTIRRGLRGSNCPARCLVSNAAETAAGNGLPVRREAVQRNRWALLGALSPAQPQIQRARRRAAATPLPLPAARTAAMSAAPRSGAPAVRRRLVDQTAP